MSDRLHGAPRVAGKAFGRSRPPRERSRGFGTISRVLAAIACMFALAGCQPGSKRTHRDQATERWNEVKARFKSQLARQQYDERLYEKALLAATEAISLDPRKVEPYAVLARAQLELGRLASAQSTLDAARQGSLRAAELDYLEGVILEQQGDLAAAIEKYRSARTSDPRQVDFLIAEVECAVAMGMDGEALALLDEHANDYNERGELAALGGRLLAKRGDMAGAIDRYRRALGEVGAGRWVSRELGLLLWQAHRYGEAVALLRPRVLEPEPGAEPNVAVLRALAECHLAAGSPEEAKPVLIEYVRLRPDSGDAQLQLAKVALETEDLPTAIDAAAAAHRLDPDRAEVGLVRATVQWRRGDAAAAEASLADVLARAPDDADAHCLLAEVLRAQRKTERARAHFLRALELEPQSAWAKFGLIALRQTPTLPIESEETAPAAKLTSAGPDRAR